MTKQLIRGGEREKCKHKARRGVQGRTQIMDASCQSQYLLSILHTVCVVSQVAAHT